MKRLLAILAVLLPMLGASAQTLPLADGATASLITCGPGDEFYLAFGHSALRVRDTARGIDRVYNYGTFDFGEPHFYLKFARGQMNYCLSRTTYDDFMGTYAYEGRAVWEQPLNLSAQEVNNLFVMLEWNYLPDNRYYRYDFFRDNCATRVRDMVEAAVGHRRLEYGERNAGRSYRRMVHESAGPCQQWWTLGVDLLLGLPADRRCDTREAMFHPLRMSEVFAGAAVGEAGEQDALVGQGRQLLADRRAPLRRSFPPVVVFALVLVAVALLVWRGLWPRWASRVLLALAGLAGLFLCYMWFGTSHWCTRWNLNILWLSPLLLLIAVRLERSPRWALWLQEGCFLVAAVWVVVCGLSVAVIPLILTLALLVARPLLSRRPWRG